MDKAFSIEDALVYLDKVNNLLCKSFVRHVFIITSAHKQIKCAYAHQPDVYGKFLSIMKDYKKQM